jgi:hypothetical protein
MLSDSLFEADLDKPTSRNDEPAFDAANALRLGQDLIYLSIQEHWWRLDRYESIQH